MPVSKPCYENMPPDAWLAPATAYRAASLRAEVKRLQEENKWLRVQADISEGIRDEVRRLRAILRDSTEGRD